MQLRKVLPLLAVSTFCLVGCASKVDYAKFNEQAKAANEKAKDVSYSKVVLDGYYTDDGQKQSFDKVTVKFEKGSYAATDILHLDEVAYALVLEGLKAQNIPNDDKATYYAGSTFKVVYDDGEKNTYEWNQYGLLTSIKGSDSKLTVSYTK